MFLSVVAKPRERVGLRSVFANLRPRLPTKGERGWTGRAQTHLRTGKPCLGYRHIAYASDRTSAQLKAAADSDGHPLAAWARAKLLKLAKEGQDET